MAKNRHQKVPKSDFSKSIFNVKNPSKLSEKKKFLKNINLEATFLFLSILCSIKIKWLLFLKFLKNLAFFDRYLWPFNKTHEFFLPFLWSVQSWLQSEMFISNSVDMMKNLHEERTENLLGPDNIIKFLKHFMNILLEK